MPGLTDTTTEKSFQSHANSDPGWGTTLRRKMCLTACKYLGIPIDSVGSDPSDSKLVSTIKNGLGVAFHSVLHSPEIYLEGSSLEKVRNDPGFLRLQREKVLYEIKRDPSYKSKELTGKGSFGFQFGGRRARGEMWRQALGFWKDEYSATWEMAFNELTWTVRSTTVYYKYSVDLDGHATVNYSFTDTLDLRPSWGDRSWEYNAICTVLGFIYHDVLGSSDELKIKARWSTRVR